MTKSKMLQKAPFLTLVWRGGSRENARESSITSRLWLILTTGFLLCFNEILECPESDLITLLVQVNFSHSFHLFKYVLQHILLEVLSNPLSNLSVRSHETSREHAGHHVHWTKWFHFRTPGQCELTLESFHLTTPYLILCLNEVGNCLGVGRRFFS